MARRLPPEQRPDHLRAVAAPQRTRNYRGNWPRRARAAAPLAFHLPYGQEFLTPSVWEDAQALRRFVHRNFYDEVMRDLLVYEGQT